MSGINKVITYENLEKTVRQYLAAQELEKLRQHLVDQHPANIAAVIDHLAHPDRHKVFALLERPKAVKVLDELNTQSTQQLFDQDLTPQQIGAYLNEMPLDEATYILAEDIPQRQQELLAQMSPEQSAKVRAILRYPSKSAGRLMTENFVRVRPEMTVEETLAYLRQIHPNVETLTNLYIVNETDQLVGVVSLREIVVVPLERKLSELMNTQLVSVPPELDQEEVARLISHYDYLAVPVVTADNTLLGIITVDDVIDVLVEENTEDMLKFGGLEGGGTIDQPYFTIPIITVLRKRVGWLLLLFLAETFTGTVLRTFEAELAVVVALSFFIPLLIGTGGNTGAQTVSTIIRGLALHEIQLNDARRVVLRELFVGVLIGLILGSVAVGRTLLWGNGLDLALVVGLAIFAICTWANTIGSVIPMMAQRFNIDPAVVSAPLITTLVDATGLAIYMLIAKAILDTI